MSQEKLPVTGRIPPVTNGVQYLLQKDFFPVKDRTFLVTENLFSVTEIKKQHLVPQYIFPVNERIFLHRQNKEHLMSQRIFHGVGQAN